MSDEEDIDVNINDQLVLIAGESGTGKSASLMNIPHQERWAYLNCEAGKRLPFRNKFQSLTITDPYEVHDALDNITGNEDFDGVIIDTVTFLMEMFESVHIVPSNDTQKAWGHYAQFFKKMMQQYVARCDKSVIFLGHTLSVLNEKEMAYQTRVPVKGSLKNNGIEAYFSTVVATKKVSLKQLEPFQSDLLTITDQDRLLGYKHVFQTQLTKETVGERIRSPMGMFTTSQTYMDNDAALLLEHVKSYYA
jgi:hypothetical protein